MVEAKQKVRKYSKALMIVAMVFMFFALLSALKNLFMLFTISSWNYTVVYDHQTNQMHYIKVSTAALFLFLVVKFAVSGTIIYSGKKTLDTFKPLVKEIDD